MGPQIDLSREEIAQTVITIVTALVAARDIPPIEATERAVEIIKEAFSAADTLMYDCYQPPVVET